MAIVLLLVGVVVLVVGAETLVRGASRLALLLGVSPLVIGLTIVAGGTSAPELAVSATAAAGGSGDLAVGNVIGSNILNVLLILGLSAVVAPLAVAKRLVRLDVPVMVVVSIGVWALAANGQVGRIEGMVLLGLLVVYTVVVVRQGRAEDSDPEADERKPTRRSVARDVLLVVVGLALLVLGSNLMVDGATSIARSVGVSELTIGLTVVALGTSLPELATSVIASVRGARDLAVGNVVGSNLFNLMAVLGVSAVVAPDGLPVTDEVLRFDFPIVVATAVACLPIFFTGHRIDRWEGGLFLAYYVAYVVYVVAAAVAASPVDDFVGAALWFVTPITAVTLGVLALREIRGARP